MTSTTARTLVATTSAGVTVRYRTRAGYTYAAVTTGRTATLAAKGYSTESVRRRARTAVGSYAFEVVPFTVEVQGVAETEIPPAIAAHFERKREQAGSPARKVPQIAERFVPGKGWITCTTYVPATYTEIRRFAAAGAVEVGVIAYGSPVSDFPIAPMLREAGRPLLGGSLIGSRTV